MLLLISGISLSLLMFGVVIATNGNMAGVLVISASVISFVWTYLRDKSRALEQNKAIAESNQRRIKELTSRMKSSNFVMEVRGSTCFMYALLCLAMGAISLFVADANHSLFLAAVGILFSLAGCFILLLGLKTLGKPKLVITTEGIQSPFSPLIPWSAVDGIFLRANSYEDLVLSHTLMLLIPSLPDEIDRFSWPFRFLFMLRTKAGKKQFFVMLKGCSEAPEVIHAVTRQLWSQKTGCQHDWNPNMSQEFNQALRSRSEAIELLMNRKTPGLTTMPEAMRTAASSEEVITRELKSKVRTVIWLSWISIGVSVIYLLWL